ncbi:hypothetical protein D3C76_1649280 [compost metagenome]
MMFAFCVFNWLDTELKRLLRAWASLSNNWREASSPGLALTFCTEAKNLVRAPLRPVPLSDSKVSSGVTCPRYAAESLLSDVVVCNCASR